MQNYQRLIAEGRATGECVPPGTQILTKNKGWVNIEEIHAGEEIFSLNVENYQIQTEEISRTVRLPYKDQMVHIQNKSMDMMLTKNHIVVLWDRNSKPYTLKAIELYEALKNNDSKVLHSCVKRGGNWVGEEPTEIQIAGKSINTETWAAFLGIYLAEGSCAGTKGRKKTSIS